jgi:hypothetical protein
MYLPSISSLRTAVLALAVGLLSTALPERAEAMCGGNILLTCPAKAQPPAGMGETRTKQRKRKLPARTAQR